MYCGDDVEAVVGDVGSGISKFGLAGEDTPKVVIPTFVGRRKDDSVVVNGLEAAEQVELTSGASDWDAMEKLWSYAFHNLHIEPASHPVIASSTNDLQRYMTMMMETFQVPAFYAAPDAVLNAFAFGRSTALIADIGFGSSRVTPVVDGYVLHQPKQTSSVGCNRLDQYLQEIVEKKYPNADTSPRRCFSISYNASEGKVATRREHNMTSSHLDYLKRQLFAQTRESICFTSGSPVDNDDTDESLDESFELPDGQVVKLAKERYQVPELLLQPPASESKKGLSSMLYDAVEGCDADLRRDLLSNIILCGGGSLTTGLTERLHQDLTSRVPSTFKVRFLNGVQVEHQFSCFIGGSILASLGSFQQLWISKQEYEEVGVDRLCQERLQ